jgi:hypothetical protein
MMYGGVSKALRIEQQFKTWNVLLIKHEEMQVTVNLQALSFTLGHFQHLPCVRHG